MDDAEIENFHDQHCVEEGHKPLFLILRDDQSKRLNGNIQTENSHVLSGKVSLGKLRREIQAALAEAGSHADSTNSDENYSEVREGAAQ